MLQKISATQPMLHQCSPHLQQPLLTSVGGNQQSTWGLCSELKECLCIYGHELQYNICVTHGGNQAFVNLVLSLVDEGDSVVLFRPAYFDHLMVRVVLSCANGGGEGPSWMLHLFDHLMVGEGV